MRPNILQNSTISTSHIKIYLGCAGIWWNIPANKAPNFGCSPTDLPSMWTWQAETADLNEFQVLIYSWLKRINLSFITPASPLIPGWFTISCWTFSPWIWDKIGSIAWNYFHLQTFPETFHIANLSDFASTNEWLFPCGFVNNFIIWCRRNRGCTDIFESWVYQGWVCRVGFTIILDDLSFLWGSSLEPDLSSWMEGKRNRAPSCPKDAGMHLLQC